LFLSEVAKVLYAPRKAFKQIIENPKYLAIVVIFIIFVAAQVGFAYAQAQKIYYEEVTPQQTAADYRPYVGAWTDNVTLWQAGPGVTITQNYANTLNDTHYGNGSLQISGSTLTSASATLSGISADCGSDSFQNFSLRVNILEPSTAPQTVTLMMFSESGYFQYDLTSYFASSTPGVWNNLTIPVGSAAAGWENNGNGQWSNITSIRLDFGYASDETVTVLLQGVMFRGLYETATQVDMTGFFIYTLQSAIFQFVFEWLIFTALIYLLIKGFKGVVVWRPLFIAIGYALTILIVQALISAAVTPILPITHSPIELQIGLAGEAQAISNALPAMTTTYFTITLDAIPLIFYAWTVVLAAFVIRTLLPEFSWTKSIITPAIALVLTIILTNLLSAI
jgi:hypothetical protein